MKFSWFWKKCHNFSEFPLGNSADFEQKGEILNYFLFEIQLILKKMSQLFTISSCKFSWFWTKWREQNVNKMFQFSHFPVSNWAFRSKRFKIKVFSYSLTNPDNFSNLNGAFDLLQAGLRLKWQHFWKTTHFWFTTVVKATISL